MISFRVRAQRRQFGKQRLRAPYTLLTAAVAVAASLGSALPAAAASPVSPRAAPGTAVPGAAVPGAAAHGAGQAPGGPGHGAATRFARRPAAAQNHATGALSTVALDVVNGGYTAAGTGMRNLGHGTIKITGVPAGATVKSAVLMWDVLAEQKDSSFAHGTLDGHAVTGTAWGTGASPCWPGTSANWSYEADVTKLVAGNGSFSLAGFATGESDGADPWTQEQDSPPLLEGASLIVVYHKASMPQAVIQIAEGASELGDTSASATLNGFTADEPAAATTTYIVADGQTNQGTNGNSVGFGGETLPDVSINGADPQAAPSYSNGNLWDTITAGVSSRVHPGEGSAPVTLTSSTDTSGSYDCLVWVGQVLSVRQAPVGIYSPFRTESHVTDALNDGWTLIGNVAGQGNPKNTSDPAYKTCASPWVGSTGSDAAVERALGAYRKDHVADISWVSYWTPAVPPAGKDPAATEKELRADGVAAGKHAAKETAAAEGISHLLPSDVILDFEPSPQAKSCGKDIAKGQKKPKEGDKQCWRWTGAAKDRNCFSIGEAGWKAFAQGWAEGVLTGVEDLPVRAAVYVSPYEYDHYHVATFNVPAVLAATSKQQTVPASPPRTAADITGYAAYYAVCGKSQADMKNLVSWPGDFATLQFGAASTVCKSGPS
jgi:hypothetical protein